jgi:cysteine desulfurase
MTADPVGEAQPPIYLDYQATTPVDARVLEAMLPYLGAEFGNPSSAHVYGRVAAEAVRVARRRVRALIGAQSEEEIVFTSCGSESNQLALAGAAHALRGRGNHIVTTAIEHPSVLATCERLESEGFAVTRLPVGSGGLVDPSEVEHAIGDGTILVSVMHANNEIGTLQPLAQIGAVTRRRGVLLHTDAAQSLATVAVDVDRLGVDLLSIAGHKAYAPKGVGALYVRARAVSLVPQLLGGGQEGGRRSGTENVASIVGLGRAAELAAAERDSDAARILELRDRLHRGLSEAIANIRVNGSLGQRLPGNLSITIPGVEAAELIAAVPRLAISAGAACHSDDDAASHVLSAIGLGPADARSTVRIGIGRFTTAEEIDAAAALIVSAAHALSRQPA